MCYVIMIVLIGESGVVMSLLARRIPHLCDGGDQGCYYSIEEEGGGVYVCYYDSIERVRFKPLRWWRLGFL